MKRKTIVEKEVNRECNLGMEEYRNKPIIASNSNNNSNSNKNGNGNGDGKEEKSCQKSKSKLTVDLSFRGELKKRRCGPPSTFIKYQVIFRTVENMGVKHKREIFKITRENKQLDENWLFPHYGITAGEFAFYNLYFENCKKWQWESSNNLKSKKLRLHEEENTKIHEKSKNSQENKNVEEDEEEEEEEQEEDEEGEYENGNIDTSEENDQNMKKQEETEETEEIEEYQGDNMYKNTKDQDQE